MNYDRMLPQPVILGLQNTTGGVDGATTEPRIRISRPATRAHDARFQERRVRAKISLVHAATYNIFNVQRHLTSARTHRAFRASAMQTWREVIVAA
jgi:hypothetical protein